MKAKWVTKRLVALLMLCALLATNSFSSVYAGEQNENEETILEDENQEETEEIQSEKDSEEQSEEDSEEEESADPEVTVDVSLDDLLGGDIPEDEDDEINPEDPPVVCEHSYDVIKLNDDGMEVQVCSKCGEEDPDYVAKNPVPLITSLEATKGEGEETVAISSDSSVTYEEPIKIVVSAKCESTKGMNLILLVYDQVLKDRTYVNANTVSEADGVKTYTFNLGATNTCYTIYGAFAYNNEWNNKNAFKPFECRVDYRDDNYYRYCDLQTYVEAIDEESGSSAPVWQSNPSNDNGIWFSESAHSGATLTVRVSGPSRYAIMNPVLEYTVKENGENVTKQITCESPVCDWNPSGFVDKDNDSIGCDFPDIYQTLRDYMPVSDVYNSRYTNNYVFKVPSDVGRKYAFKYTLNNRRKTSGTIDVTTYIDNSAPTINPVTFNGKETPVGSADADQGFYSEDVEILATVYDENFDAAEELENLVLTNTTTGEVQHFKKKEETADGKYIYYAVASENGSYKVSGSVSDYAGNVGSITESEFVIDHTSPTIEISFDNTDVKNGKYYSAARTATIKVTDENFATDDRFTTLTLNQKAGTATTGGWSKTGDNSYERQITFEQDGIYSFSIYCRDRAGNTSETKSESEFIIDRTAPEITVSFDNNSAANDMYFNAGRTATIKIKDVTFSESLVTILNANEVGLSNLPSRTGFTESDSTYTSTMRFDADGKYAFTITATDLAGNTSSTYSSGVFYIDTVAPEVQITGVTDMSANNGAVAPVVTSTDENLKFEDVVVTLTGANNGEVAATKEVTNLDKGFTISLADLPHEKAMDDFYTLTVTVKDLAGNETKSEISYSLNRFGSVYVLGPSTRQMVSGYYVLNPEDVVITEINVDTLSYKEVSLAFDGTVRELSEGRDYSVSETVDNKSWHSISYTIHKNNFNEDGIYSISVFSEDKATNRQSNTSKDAEIEFLLDATAPSVVVAGIEDGEKYEEKSHDISINAVDTIGVKALAVYLDEKELAVFTADELRKSGGTEIVTIPGKMATQEVVIVSTDIAGNETRLSYNIVVSEKAEIIQIKPGPQPLRHFWETKTGKVTVVAVMFAAVAGAFVVRRKRIK